MRKTSGLQRRRLTITGLLGALCLTSSGCQLVALPFQLLMGVAGLAVKLLPIITLFVFEPIEPQQLPGELPQESEVRLASLDLLEGRLLSAQELQAATASEEEGLVALLPALEVSWLSSRARPGYRLAGVILLPASRVQEAGDLAPLMQELGEAGYQVEVGELTDGAELAGDDLLPSARFAAATQAEGLTVITADPLSHLATAETSAGLTACLPEGLEPLLSR